MKHKYVKALAACLLAGGASVHMSGFCADLQVAPVSITLSAQQTADAVWLSNPGTKPLQAQVRVFQWSQQAGADQLVPTMDLVASPPMLSVMPGQRQMVRIMRVNGALPEGATEQSFRVVIDEIPTQDEAAGLQFALRYLLPVFVQPQNVTAATLTWQIERKGHEVWLRAANSGQIHAQIADVTFVSASGRAVALSEGLFGYALAGSERVWKLPRSEKTFLDGGTLRATINQKPAQFRIPAASAS